MTRYADSSSKESVGMIAIYEDLRLRCSTRNKKWLPVNMAAIEILEVGSINE